jgi:lipoyl(octanoyl) transferase
MQVSIEHSLVDYETAQAKMAEFVANRQETIWILQHPPMITSGTSAKEYDILDSNTFPIYKTGRGGENTYHGPGQLICYIMMDLEKRDKKDLKAFVYFIEGIVLEVLGSFGLDGIRIEGKRGIFVEDKKIAAIGVRVQKWFTSHGFSLNINPDLSHYSAIVPCGIKEYGITSMQQLNIQTNFTEVAEKLSSSILARGVYKFNTYEAF